MTRRLVFVALFLLAIWTTFQIWQITVRENLASAYALQTHEDAPQRQENISGIHPKEAGETADLQTLAQDIDNLDAQVDRLVRSQRENIRELRGQPAARGGGRELQMIATGYTAGPESTGKHPGDPGYGITYSGLKADSGVAAVDPKVIPLKSVLWVEGYGYAIALDTGTDIVGLRIDLFFHQVEDALRWGRKRVRVRIIQ